jgi:hypothetical protein
MGITGDLLNIELFCDRQIKFSSLISDPQNWRLV